MPISDYLRVAFAGCLLGLASAHALTIADLAEVAAAPPPGAQLPQNLTVHALERPDVVLKALVNRPTILIFADYTCATLCSPVIALTGHALADTGFQEGIDYQLIVIGIDPKDSDDAARAMRNAQLGPGSHATFALPDTIQLKALTDALGYRFTYDPTHDQYAHVAASYVLDRSGKVVRVLSGLGLDAADFRLALVEAGKGALGGISDQIHLLCYGFDPVQGAYNLAVSRLLSISAGVSVLGLGGLIGVLILLSRRARSET